MTQPSGWYDDPQDPAYLRYFDGVTWTDHRAPKQASQVAQSHIGEGAHVEDFRRPGQQSHHDDRSGGQSPYVVPTARPGDAPRDGTDRPGGGPKGHQQQGYHQHGYQQQGYQQRGYQHGYQPQGYGPAPAMTPDGHRLSGWWRRLGALLIDGFLLNLLLSPLYVRLLGPTIDRWQGWWDEVGAAVDAGSSTVPPAPQIPLGIQLQVAAVMVLAFLIYEVFCLSRWGRTLGRVVTGISVRALESPTPAPVGRLMLRTIVKRVGDLIPSVLGIAFTLLDGLFPLWDRPMRQALHDKAGRTCVVVGKLPRRG
ncbi:RDD family protein [Arsenicicoccus sp. oral taxon 190]|uniref:RDD family protein n=1 Tax=Arsenicicoccus sp. oral taxon 190 TaxID=1658671 RepID=UPI00067A2274|nr:RDD family protein [Arsenicicoccus sp. oral taxon 190]AKT51479.1 hypothetical protein ADJ73_09375 [Arsenicicoccus sp. oral taxon 190]